MKHTVIYVPGLGDRKVRGRQAIVAAWRLYGVRPVVHQMNWADGQPFEPKLKALLLHIDKLVDEGFMVSLVGESAGASATMNAYAARQNVIHRVVFICGKLRNPHTISSHTYRLNPAFAESMAQLPASMQRLGAKGLERSCSVHPLWDPTVPVPDTKVDGAHERTIPTFGHATSIVLGDTIFSLVLVSFLLKR